jgi:hypothetical protein
MEFHITFFTMLYHRVFIWKKFRKSLTVEFRSALQLFPWF